MNYSYVMGVSDIKKLKENNFEIKTFGKNYGIIFPDEKIETFEKYICENLEKGFWNEYLGKNKVFIFKFEDGKIKKYILNNDNEKEILELCCEFANYQFESIDKMLKENSFYEETYYKNKRKRITLISDINENEIIKVEKLISQIKEKTCKVPYGINDEKRYEIDNLPYHFTIFATNKTNQDRILKIAEKINISEIKLKVNDIKIMEASNNSHCLYLSIEENREIKELQRIFYKEFPKEKYNPDNFIFHMTLHIDKDYNKIIEMRKILKQYFKPFDLKFNMLALFDYPGDIIEKIKLQK